MSTRDVEKERLRWQKYYATNREKINEKKRKNYQNTHTMLKERARVKAYRKNNLQKVRERENLYKKNNRDKVKTYVAGRYKNNPNVKLAQIIRVRMRKFIKNKSYSSWSLMGADIETVKKHLENLFQNGMTWDNHGFDGWHIDHIVPCAAFDLTDPQEQKKCFHYTNLQPLWAKDNLSKGDRYEY